MNSCSRAYRHWARKLRVRGRTLTRVFFTAIAAGASGPAAKGAWPTARTGRYPQLALLASKTGYGIDGV